MFYCVRMVHFIIRCWWWNFAKLNMAFMMENRADPDEMQRLVAFHLRLFASSNRWDASHKWGTVAKWVSCRILGCGVVSSSPNSGHCCVLGQKGMTRYPYCLLSCQSGVTVTLCFVYKVIDDFTFQGRIYVISVLFCYAFMHVCLLMPCGHLLEKSWLLALVRDV